jgi:glycosyltransferase involved in cell wall biosynthesis
MEYPIMNVNGKNDLDYTGGAGISVRNLSQGLKAKGHSISIISRTLICAENSYFDDDGIDIYKVYSKNPLMETLKVTDLLKRLSKEKKIDIIETCDYAPLVGEYIENVPLVLRQRISYGFMNYRASKINSPYEIKDLKYLLRSFELQIADSYAGVSNYILNAQQHFHEIPYTKIYGVVYNGLNDNIQRTNISYNKDVIFCHGTVSKRKGTDKVCRIFKKVKNSQKHSKLLIIGQNNEFWDEYCIPELSTLNEKDYKYIEYISQSNTIQHISKSGIYVSMSNLEAMSNSMMEAMRLGKPLVLFKNGSFEEFIEDGVEGFIVI